MDYNNIQAGHGDLPYTGPPDIWTWLLVAAVIVVIGAIMRRAARCR